MSGEGSSLHLEISIILSLQMTSFTHLLVALETGGWHEDIEHKIRTSFNDKINDLGNVDAYVAIVIRNLLKDLHEAWLVLLPECLVHGVLQAVMLVRVESGTVHRNGV